RSSDLGVCVGRGSAEGGAAVHVQLVHGDVAGGVGDEETYCGGHVLGSAEASQGDADLETFGFAVDQGLGFGGHGAQHRGVGGAGGNDVAAHTQGRQFESECLGEGDRGRFGGCVGGHAGAGDPGGVGGDGDQRTVSSGAHAAGGRAADGEDPGGVDRDHSVPVVVGAVGDGAGGQGTCGTDRGGDGAQECLDPVEEGFDLRCVGDVGGEGVGFVP